MFPERSPENNVCRVAPFLFSQYIPRMLWRNSRGRPMNAPAAFIHPCQPIVCQALNSKHDGYQKYFSPVGSFGSPCSPLHKRLGQTHNSGQLPVVLLVLRPVGCLPLAGESRFRELLRMCRNWLGNSEYNQLARSYFLELA
jgi:hypothetical protein